MAARRIDGGWNPVALPAFKRITQRCAASDNGIASAGRLRWPAITLPS